MDKIVKGALLGVIGGAWVLAYGKYKYYAGRCDANKVNKIIIDIQHEIIQSLLNKEEPES